MIPPRRIEVSPPRRISGKRLIPDTISTCDKFKAAPQKAAFIILKREMDSVGDFRLHIFRLGAESDHERIFPVIACNI